MTVARPITGRVVPDELDPDYEVGYCDDDGVSWRGTEV